MNKLHQHLIAVAAMAACGATMAADVTTPAAPATAATPLTATAPAVRADRRGEMNMNKDALEEKLKAATSRDDYRKIIEANGYKISSINEDKPDYLEYEIVKGTHSLEVQLDFKDGAAKASDIDVTTNMWRADSTKRMEKDNSYQPKLAVVPNNKYSDRHYMKGWTSEKEKLEAALPPNLKVADYKPKIEKLGYKITSVNDREPDYVEYEIVKGQNSYEVQIDRDPKTMMATKVDIDTNVWDSEATDRKKEANEEKAKK